MDFKHLFVCVAGCLAVTSYGKGGDAGKPKDWPVFSSVVYEGNDAVFTKNPLRKDEFYNPILQGCYPDPSICRRGDDYYLVCSSFAMFPGVPVFHSTDLVNWRQVGHALDRPSQLKVHDAGTSNGVYAPTIRYNPHNEMFYMITTQVSGGFGNMMVKTKNPEEGWSDPIKLHFNGIDPSIFFDEDGKAYIVHNDGPKKSLWKGHRVIKLWEYDVETDKLVPGTDKVIVDGGTKLDKHPFWIEAPHIYKKDGKYYLMCAEGGTGEYHSEVVFVSDKVDGPYVESPNNPILTQRYLNPMRENKIEHAGHSDVVEGKDGKWYGVFLGIRPNEKGHSLIGRETFILPVDWSGTFPVFENGLIPMEPKQKMPAGVENKQGEDGYQPCGNFSFTDDFAGKALDNRWVGIRCNPEDFVSFVQGGLRIEPFGADISEKKPLSALWLRQMHGNFSFGATVDYRPRSESDLAGIACMQNRNAQIVLGLTKKDGRTMITLVRRLKDKTEILGESEIVGKRPVRLQVEAQGEDFRFSYSTDGHVYHNVGGKVDGAFLSTTVAGGFVGNVVGLYATSGNNR